MLEKAKDRYKICKACEKFNSVATVCNVCGCFMRFKVMIPNASCPENKWMSIKIIKEENTKE